MNVLHPEKGAKLYFKHCESEIKPMPATDTTAMGTLLSTALASINLTKILSSVLLLMVCILSMRLLMKITKKMMAKSKLERSLHGIVGSFVKIVLIFVTVLLVAGSLGIDTSSLLAILSIAGLAASLALQDCLSNLASGVMLMISKPFRAGDYVTIGGVSGSVVQIGITHTKLDTPDNQVILVPNSAVTSNIITNVSAEETRRVDLVFHAAYSADPETVITALKEAADIPQVLQDPPVFVRLSGYKEYSVEYTVRVWVRSGDYWDAYFDIIQRVKPAFDRHGVKISFPHINIHTAH